MEASDQTRFRALAEQAERMGMELKKAADRYELHRAARPWLILDDLAHVEAFLYQYRALHTFCQPIS